MVDLQVLRVVWMTYLEIFYALTFLRFTISILHQLCQFIPKTAKLLIYIELPIWWYFYKIDIPLVLFEILHQKLSMSNLNAPCMINF